MNADTFCLLHPFQFGENCGEHYDEAKTAADNVGDGFGHKNAVWSHVQVMGTTMMTLRSMEKKMAYFFLLRALKIVWPTYCSSMKINAAK